MIKLQKFNGPRETDGAQSNAYRRATVKSESQTEKHDQRPERVATVFSDEIRERKQTRPPQQASPNNQHDSYGIYRPTPLNWIAFAFISFGMTLRASS